MVEAWRRVAADLRSYKAHRVRVGGCEWPASVRHRQTPPRKKQTNIPAMCSKNASQPPSSAISWQTARRRSVKMSFIFVSHQLQQRCIARPPVNEHAQPWVVLRHLPELRIHQFQHRTNPRIDKSDVIENLHHAL